MSWIDERLAERQALVERNRLLDDHAVQVYAAVWKEMMTFVEEAKTKGFSNLLTNGSVQNRRLILAVPGNDKTLSVTMTDKRIIRASCSGKESRFELDVCDGGIVCLRHDGEQVTEQEAARRILDPFLFPDLPPANTSAALIEKW
jgi:hypothetical protein